MRNTEREKERERHTQRQADRYRERERDKDTHTDRQRNKTGNKFARIKREKAEKIDPHRCFQRSCHSEEDRRYQQAKWCRD